MFYHFSCVYLFAPKAVREMIGHCVDRTIAKIKKRSVQCIKEPPAAASRLHSKFLKGKEPENAYDLNILR